MASSNPCSGLGWAGWAGWASQACWAGDFLSLVLANIDNFEKHVLKPLATDAFLLELLKTIDFIVISAPRNSVSEATWSTGNLKEICAPQENLSKPFKTCAILSIILCGAALGLSFWRRYIGFCSV